MIWGYKLCAATIALLSTPTARHSHAQHSKQICSELASLSPAEHKRGTKSVHVSPSSIRNKIQKDGSEDR
eukprot:3461362-Amphidinium_carterae.1